MSAGTLPAQMKTPLSDRHGARALLVITLLFAICAWCVQLGGLSALYYGCTHPSHQLSNFANDHDLGRVSDLFANLTALRNDYTDGYIPHCAVLFSFQWFMTAGDLRLACHMLID